MVGLRGLASVGLERGDIHTVVMAVMVWRWGGERDKLRITVGFQLGCRLSKCYCLSIRLPPGRVEGRGAESEANQ